MRALQRSGDPQSNKETRPPDGETVTLRSVTLADVYIGREADALASALGAIEWVNVGAIIADNIAEARKGESYYYAEFILAPAPLPLLSLRGFGKASPPEGVKRVYGQIYVLGPSMLALVLTFDLSDTERGRLDAEMRRDAESDTTQLPSGKHRPVSVFEVKSERVRNLYDELGNRCLAWLKEQFPGTLTAGGDLGVPICWLVSFAKGSPFQTRAEYMRLLKLSKGFFGFKFVRPDYLYLTPLIGPTRRPEFIAALNEAEALISGSYSDPSIAPQLLHAEIWRFMVTEAVKEVFRSLEYRIRAIRSDLEKVDFEGAVGTLTLVSRFRNWLPFNRTDDSKVVPLRNRLLGLSRDIALVCGDVTIVVNDATTIWGDYPLLIQVSPNKSLPLTAQDTADSARQNLRSLISNIQDQEKALRELVLVTSEAIRDVQDAKTQKTLNGLTVALVILTIVLVFLGIVQLVDSPSSGTSPSGVPHASTLTTSRPPVSTTSLRPTPSSVVPKKGA